MTHPTPSQEARPVAFFDFDGTLTTGDTLMPFLKYLVGAPKYYLKLALVSPVLMAYFTKLLRNDIAKQIVLKQYLAGYHIDELFELGKQFSEEVIPTMLRPEGMERLRWHQAQGHECVLVSASLDVYLQEWSRTEGFLNLMCTSLRVDESSLVSGTLDGENCHGQEKVVRIKDFLKGSAFGMTYGYGDTDGDIPMLYHLDASYFWSRRETEFKVFKGFDYE